MSNLPPSAKVSEQNGQIHRLREIITGVRSRKPISEFFSDLDFSDLEADVHAVDLTVDSSAQDLLRATLLAGALRDLQYAHATRGHMLALGTHNAMREAFELTKILVDSGQKTA